MDLWFHALTFVLATCFVGLATACICWRWMGDGSRGASDDYFAGGRSLRWYVVAGSLMLTNLSTEQLVGLNGSIFADGCLSGLWWEAGAAIAMTATAMVFLPRYMALGLTTTSGFLGARYGLVVRTLVSTIFLIYYVVILCPLVLYTGALAIRNIFDLQVPLWTVSLVIGVLGACYALVGGLKAVAVSDCINGIGLIVVGLWVPIAALSHIGGVSKLFEDPAYLRPLAASSMKYTDENHSRSPGLPSLPWHVVLTGLTLNNLYYWSTNQVIVQRVLAAKSLAEGQKGVMFAACMKVVGFTFLCLPGIIGILLVKEKAVINGRVFQVRKADEVYPELVKAVMPEWSLGLFAAVLIGSVLSTFNSALNSASTIFGLEIYKMYINTTASDQKTVRVATMFGAAMTMASFLIAPCLEALCDHIFDYLQHVNTIVSLPIISVFLVGILSSLPDVFAAKVGFAVGALAVGCGQLQSELHYLHVYFISFILAVGAMLLTTYLPGLRRLLRQEPVPKPCAFSMEGALVELSPWMGLRCITAAVFVALALLVLSLQLGSLWLFCAFWGFWLVMLITLFVIPTRPASASIQSKDAMSVTQNAVDEDATIVGAGFKGVASV
eukprot:TRINITY_DN34224_c0_g1_i1.p1 TRINITY_DN34224_c0_g1~~TRINITY_DN34224_c0_g1_i1.p1  ORF type:complete len:610 (-),score=80.75 TRINITY_DN34224_c0_g1_i1:276-2105(-)